VASRFFRRQVLVSGASAAIGAGAGLLGARTGSQASADARTTAATVPETPASVSPSGLAVLHAGLAARLTAPCRIAFAGSSTTAGTGATSPDRSYVSVLVAALQRLHPSGTGRESQVHRSPLADFGRPGTTPGVHGYNTGRPGTRVATYLDAAGVAAIAALAPCAVVHMVGSNDFAGGVSPEQYRMGVVQQLDRFRAVGTAPCVHVLVQSYERSDRRSYRHPWPRYGDALAGIAEADPDTVVLDVSGPYHRAGVPGEDLLHPMSTDRVHQNDRGHAFMADAIRSALTVN
jgi:lysophospholipase L1-like esterase